MTNAEKKRLMIFLKALLWSDGKAEADEVIYNELKNHALLALPAGVMAYIQMPDKLRHQWKVDIFQHILYNVHYQHEQDSLPISVPYAILKGTSAAKYYPHPYYRSMGDIDIIVQENDGTIACQQLLNAGYLENTSKEAMISGRHRQFRKNGIEVEIHTGFAYHHDPEKEKTLDTWIVSNIPTSHVLPDNLNGLVILNHISYHIDVGIGLRQIIDWMMFVSKCLPDEKWPTFQVLAQETGQEQLALITTRMCELYLGLPEHRYCVEVDPAVCEMFMDYVLSCGNFGKKMEEDYKTSQRFIASMRTVKGAYQFLQCRGLMNWPAVNKYMFLRPFAWIYQAFRYLKKGLLREGTLKKLKTEREMAKKRNMLFDALGVTRKEKGIVRYRNGEYVKH